MTIEPDNQKNHALRLALDQRHGALDAADEAALRDDPELAGAAREASHFLERLRAARLQAPPGHVDRVLAQVASKQARFGLLRALWPPVAGMPAGRLALRRTVAVAAGILIGVILHLGLVAAERSQDPGLAGDSFVLGPPR